MESRAKQRLTGAIILVALFVLLVPELLTGPRDAHPDAPSSEQGMRRYTIDLDAQRAPPVVGSAANDAPVTLPPVATPANPVPGGDSPARAKPGEAAAPESVAPPVTTAPLSPAPSKPNALTNGPGSAPVAHAEAPRGDVPRSEAPRAAPSRPAVEGVRYAVQLGTFGKRENADRLARDMTAKGFAAFVDPTTTNGHDLYRVRVGPARNRAAAEALAAELKRVGQPGSIVPIS